MYYNNHGVLHMNLSDNVLRMRVHSKDTSSVNVLCAKLSEEIHDYEFELRIKPCKQTRYYLLQAVHKRRKLLEYLRSTNTERYRFLISKLNMRE